LMKVEQGMRERRGSSDRRIKGWERDAWGTPGQRYKTHVVLCPGILMTQGRVDRDRKQEGRNDRTFFENAKMERKQEVIARPNQQIMYELEIWGPCTHSYKGGRKSADEGGLLNAWEATILLPSKRREAMVNILIMI